jgi:hypothetical protein
MKSAVKAAKTSLPLGAARMDKTTAGFFMRVFVCYNARSRG